MNELDDATWKRLFPLVEQAQDYADAELEDFLLKLAVENPDLEPLLREMLQKLAQSDSADFLEQPLHFEAPDRTRIGQQVGAYTIESLLGRGGMGEVWLAHRSDGRFQGLFAVKFLGMIAPTSLALERFRREGRTLARLTHPSIARLIDAGVMPDGHPYLVLEYVLGEPIDVYCSSHSLGLHARIQLMLSVLDAIAHAHTRLVVHRDIKPSNVLVTPEGEVKLLDFGVAKLLGDDPGEEAQSQPTRLEDVALTPDFAAPEQILGESPSTETDVYQAGALMYLLLAGRLPLSTSATTRAEKVRAALDENPRRLSDAAITDRKAMRGDLDAIVEKTLRKRPRERYPTAAALAADLRRYLNHEPVTAREGAFAYRAEKFIRRYRAAVVATAVAVLVLLGATTFALIQMREAQLQRDQARFQQKRGDAENQFLTQVLSTVAPDGAPVTPAQILEKGVSMLDRQYANDPAFRTDLLIRMALGFMTMNDVDKGLQSLEKARKIAARFTDPVWTVKIECAAAQFELSQDQGDQAAASLQKGMAALARVRDPNAIDSARCILAQSALYTQRNELPEAAAEGKKALALLESAGLTSDPLYADAMSSLQDLYGAIGNPTETYNFVAREVTVLEHSGQGESQTGVGAHHDLAAELASIGEFKAAAEEEDLAVKRMRSAMGVEPIPAVVMLTYGGILLKVDRLEQGLQAEEEAVRAAVREKSASGEAYARQAHARLLLEAGRLDEADLEVAAVKQVTAGRQIGQASARHVSALTGGVEADVLRKRGKLVEAASLLESTLQKAKKDGLPENSTAVRYLLVVSSRIALADHRFADAATAAAAALVIDEKRARDPKLSANVGESLLLLAGAQQGLGQNTEARATAARAYVSLRAGLGPNVRATLEAAAFTSSPLAGTPHVP